MGRRGTTKKQGRDTLLRDVVHKKERKICLVQEVCHLVRLHIELILPRGLPRLLQRGALVSPRGWVRTPHVKTRK